MATSSQASSVVSPGPLEASISPLLTKLRVTQHCLKAPLFLWPSLVWSRCDVGLRLVPSQLSLNRKCVRQSVYFKCAVLMVPVSPGCSSVDEWAKWCGPWLIHCLRNVLRSLVHALWDMQSFTLCSLHVRSHPLEIDRDERTHCIKVKLPSVRKASRSLHGKGEVNRQCTISHRLSPSFLVPLSDEGS